MPGFDAEANEAFTTAKVKSANICFCNTRDELESVLVAHRLAPGDYLCVLNFLKPGTLLPPASCLCTYSHMMQLRTAPLLRHLVVRVPCFCCSKSGLLSSSSCITDAQVLITLLAQRVRGQALIYSCDCDSRASKSWFVQTFGEDVLRLHSSSPWPPGTDVLNGTDNCHTALRDLLRAANVTGARALKLLMG